MLRSHFVLRWSMIPVLSALLLAGCGGDDGATGEAGPPGQSAVRTVDSASSLNAVITNVSVPDDTGTPVVSFTLSNQDGVPVVGVSNVRFTMARLFAEAAGNSSRWQSYVNRTESLTGSSPGPGTENQVQATNESGGALVDNNDGSYTYTFRNSVTAVTSPVAVAYEPAATHRVAMQINADANLPTANAVYTWQPSTGATTGISARDVVVTESCNECHGTLALHGGGRIDTRYCVTCHNPGSTDANSANTVDFKVMIHKIHRGASLPSVAAGGGDYTIYGFRDDPHDYSEIHFPQDIRGCAKCHDEADTVNTPQAGNWQSRPTMEACGSCHDDINFAAAADGVPEAWNRAHPGGVQADNSTCADCHDATLTTGLGPSVADAHAIPERAATARYAFSVVSVTNSGPNQAPRVVFRVFNPLTGTNYDTATDAGWVGGGRITLRAAWSTTDYENVDSAKGALQPIDVNGISAAIKQPNGNYLVDFTSPIPASASGSGVITIEGRAIEDLDGDGNVNDTVPVKAAVGFFAITDAAPVARRATVDIANCDLCHEQLSLHGDNRTDEPQLCVVCHNNNRTDIGRRGAADPDLSTPDINEAYLDGKFEESIDFKRMIHGLHGSTKRETSMVIYGFGGNPFIAEDEIHFPGVLSNCLTCHVAGSYELPLASGIGATTISTGADIDDPSDDLNITPTAAACSGCHDGGLAEAHMIQNGALFDATEAQLPSAIETCAVCHGPGRTADLNVVHGID